ncbi:SGNH/GDSL hydrolase family protein [Paenibacillus sp. GCM10027626]|uniref:SGNH/GDSL hydrolase family protein n=1 Tax=Paenibacillus sp. GCM10027626 TaxID=3273411 RepID=UPI0036437928
MANEGRLYIATLIPINGLEEEVNAFNSRLKAVIEARNETRFQLVNLHDALELSDLRDGVHPTDEGYDKMAEAWYKAISESFLKG